MVDNPNSQEPSAFRRAKRATLVTLVVYVLLVATHLGEFWPFSIYPMFSRGGYPWVRTLVRDVSDESLISWEPSDLTEIQGDPFAMGSTGINQNDVANFVSKSGTWDEEKTLALRTLFGAHLTESSLLLYRVEGRLSDAREVGIEYEPFILLSPDSTVFGHRIEEGLTQ
jgi:hypothetical protein